MRGAGLLAGGTALGQAIVLLAMPVVTRLYGPNDFGLLAVYASLLALLVVVITLRYEVSIVLAHSDEDAAQILATCLLVSCAVALSTAGGIAVGGRNIAHWFNTPGIAPYLWLLPISALAAGVYQTFSYWALRKGNYRRLAGTKILQNASMVGTQVGLGAVGAGPLGLIVGDSLRWAGGSTALVSVALRRDLSSLRSVRWSRVREQARRFWKFPMLSAPSSLANTLGQQLPPLLIAAFYGPQVAGGFYIVQKILAVPVTLLGRAIGDAYISEFGGIVRASPARAKETYRQTAVLLLAVGILPTLILIIGGRTLLPFFLGAEWRDAGIYLQIVALMFLAKFVVNPLSQTLVLLERQGAQLGWDLGRLMIVNGAIIATARAGGSPTSAVAAYSLSMLVAYVVLYGISMHHLTQVVRQRHGASHEAEHVGSAT